MSAASKSFASEESIESSLAIQWARRLCLAGMKHLKRSLALLLLVAVIVVCAILWARSSASSAQQKFFDAVGSGEPVRVTALFHEKLRSDVDEPILRAWMEIMNERLGRYKGLSNSEFNMKTQSTELGQVTQIVAKVELEKGTVDSTLEYLDGRLIAFNVKTDALNDDWFKGPADTSLYKNRAEEFLRHILDNRVDEAWSMMHKDVQQQISLKKLHDAAAEGRRLFSPLKSITHAGETMEPDHNFGIVLTERIRVSGAQSEDTEVRFHFTGLKGFITGFKIGREKLE